MKRTDFLKRFGAGALGGGVVLGLFASVRNAPPRYVDPGRRRRGILRPPGAQSDEEEFLSRCIRCLRCSEVCEPGAIRLFPAGYGRLEGTPHIVPEDRACTLCMKCGPACPTDALEALSDKTDARMGTAVVDKNLCVSHNGTGICGACHTACPVHDKAIVQGAHNAPTIRPEDCVGCGLCEEACIVRGDKAIRVLTPRRWT